MQTKFCPSCSEQKSIEQFNKVRASKDGVDCWCRECRKAYRANWRKEHGSANEWTYQKRWREKNREKYLEYSRSWMEKQRKENPEFLKKQQRGADLKRYYGITHDQYDGMKEKQNGLCAICLRPPEKKGLFVDHNHATGKTRELLCSRCNSALERLETVPNWDSLAAAYLARHTA